jgi:tripartite-type tricarboxylate transporter receptor subunit TctC
MCNQRRLFNRAALGVVAGAVAAGLLGGLARPAMAQSDRPISLVVGYSAGGSADLVARAVGAELSKRLNRQVIIENVTGASGMLAVQKVLGSPADGSVLYMGGTDTVVVPMVNPKFKHEWDRDFLPVGRMTTVPMVFAVPAASKYKSLSEVVKRLQAGGGENFTYATPGIGTMQHLYGALINKRAGVTMQHIPYRGGAQIANDLVGQQVDSAILVLSTAMPFLKDGKIKALSVSDTARVPELPDVKRLGEEEGFGGVALPLWQGLFVKAGTPPAVLAALERALQEALGQAELKARLKESGITVSPMKGRELRDFVAAQAAIYRDIVSSSKISVE